jgi:putative tricarboxylic transport membrane protein
MFGDIGQVLILFNPSFIMVMLAGVFGGLVVGAMPGLTSTMAVALLVPITYGMTVELGLCMLVAVYVGAISGGLVAATLLNIPGTPSSVATTYDAYPMAMRGEAGKALAYGVFASFIGGVFSFFVLLFLAPTLGNFALRFSSFEYFSLVVFALSCIISISKKSLIKGILAAAIGMSMATVGLSDIDMVARFTFNSITLQSGFEVLPVLIGMYAVSQLMLEIQNIKKPYNVMRASFTNKEFFEVVWSFRRSLKNILRSSVIGTAIGILPGVGPGLSNIVAYAQAKAADKNPDSFGQGNPDGIIASEAANNASTGGALIPLLTLGVPGDASTMMMLGAFMIHGVQPGPLLFRDHSGLVMIIMAAFFISTVLMLILQMQCIRVLVQALTIPRHILYAVITALCVIGSFALRSNMFDVWVFFAMGLAGYILTRLDFPILPLVLGLIFGRMAETEFRSSYVLGNNSLAGYLDRPIALFFLALAVLSVVISLYTIRRGKKSDMDFQEAV